MFNHKMNARILLPIVVALVIVGVTAGYIGARQAVGIPAAKDRPITTLQDINNAFVDIAARVKPAVVMVSTERYMTVRQNPMFNPFAGDLFSQFFGNPRGGQQQPQQPEEREYRQTGLGSGVLVSDDGYILTNNHVVDEADSIYVRTTDDKRYSARVIGTDPRTDLAVIKIDASGLDFVAVGNSDNLKVGEMVLAIGSPMSQNLAHTVTQGIVSATGRANVGLADYEDFIQTDAAINPGNSGGALVNLDGELVGINTAIVSRSGGFQGIGFAIPSNMAQRVMQSLIADGRVVRGYLGVYIQDITEDIAGALDLKETAGALISDVSEDSPAADAGIKQGDIIVEMDGRPIGSSTQLRNTVASTPPDTPVKFKVLRDGRTIDMRVELGELPADEAPVQTVEDLNQTLGFTVVNGTGGVVVSSVEQASRAFQAGLREGDIINAVNRKAVGSVREFTDVLDGVGGGDRILLRIERDGRGLFLAFTL
ncbi:MAG: Do family serine endopeptidase [candidate division Zixibacteria bacterium]|nr:Do family serine endopeptidase [candidate division Zixibacteria bacterium]